MPSVHLPPWIARQAAELLARPGHAWLLQGPSGLGQFELALALAAAWLCDAPTPQGACGQCPGCHSLHVHAHADFVMLMPETHMLERDWPLPKKMSITSRTASAICMTLAATRPANSSA